MDLNYLKKLIRVFDESTATELEIEEEGVKFKISRQLDNKSAQNTLPNIPFFQMPQYISQPYQQGLSPVPVSLPESQKTEKESELEKKSVPEEKHESLHEIHSPIVGTFYRAPSPDSEPFVEIGSHVIKGTTLCIVEAMKLMNEIESDISGTIVKILIENAKPVEYNQLLFLIKPD